jgi:hypothetical protein
MKSILTRMYMTVIEMIVGVIFGYLIAQKASVMIYSFTRMIGRSVGF